MYEVNIKFDEETNEDILNEYYKTLTEMKRKILEMNKYANTRESRQKATKKYGTKNDYCKVCECNFLRSSRGKHKKSIKHKKNEDKGI